MQLRRTLLFMLGMLAISMTTSVRAASIESLMMPGEVVKNHAKYEHECTKCHDRFDKARQTDLCLACHKEILKDIDKKAGFHGKKAQVREQACKSCHTEHKGRGADIVKLDKLTFDHHLTDFELRGQHTKTRCESCHKPSKKYSEAPQACHSCHAKESPHKEKMLGELSRRCDSCHTENNWRENRYDHDKTKFPLTGRHAKTDCTSCHPGDRYQKTPTQCYACHQLDDVHQGSNGKNCKKCHTTTSWKKLDFDHDRDTHFPLRERHAKVTCAACHPKDPYKVKIKSDCYSCHQHDDKHAARFGQKCQDCHSEQAWGRIKFDHDRDTKFKLRGKHSKAECTSCHKQQNIYKEKLRVDCLSCHALDDVHKGQEGKKCEACHNESGWRAQVRFEHDITKFPLVGLHAIVPCEECHLSSSYKDASIECNACHKKDDTHKGKLGLNCNRCHTPNGWKIWRFDHNTESQFKLDGKHTDVHCYSCHTQAVKIIDSTPRTCTGCHHVDDIHNGQFGARCDRCHTTSAFKEIRMNR